MNKILQSAMRGTKGKRVCSMSNMVEQRMRHAHGDAKHLMNSPNHPMDTGIGIIVKQFEDDGQLIEEKESNGEKRQSRAKMMPTFMKLAPKPTIKKKAASLGSFL